MKSKVLAHRLVILVVLPIAVVACNHASDIALVPSAPKIVVTKGGIEMCLIPAGRFQMGGNKPGEAPPHEVEVDAFLIDRCEMTQGQYARFDPINGSHFKGADRPVEMIRWDDAALFCNKRSRDEGLEPCYDEETLACNYTASGYRLPTEAEWEYACRAGSSADYCFGADSGRLADFGWFADNAGKQTHPVAQKKANAWGLHDMYGNVAEWCNDYYGKDVTGESSARNPRGPKQGTKRVLKGGAWSSPAAECRSAARAGESPGCEDACFAQDAVGFRCVRRADGAQRAAR